MLNKRKCSKNNFSKLKKAIASVKSEVKLRLKVKKIGSF